MTFAAFPAVTAYTTDSDSDSDSYSDRPMLRRLSSSVHIAVAAGRRPASARSYSAARGEAVARTRRLGVSRHCLACS